MCPLSIPYHPNEEATTLQQKASLAGPTGLFKFNLRVDDIGVVPGDEAFRAFAGAYVGGHHL